MHPNSCNECQLLHGLQLRFRVDQFADNSIHLHYQLFRCLNDVLPEHDAWYVLTDNVLHYIALALPLLIGEKRTTPVYGSSLRLARTGNTLDKALAFLLDDCVFLLLAQVYGEVFPLF